MKDFCGDGIVSYFDCIRVKILLLCCIIVLKDGVIGRKWVKDFYVMFYNYMFIYNYFKIKILVLKRCLKNIFKSKWNVEW